MRAQSHLLVKGTQFIAALTIGAGFFGQQTKTSHVSNDDLIHHDPIKDIVEKPQSGSSSILLHFPPAPRRSRTISSIKSTTTIRSFLIKRGLAHNFYKQSKETWPDYAFVHEDCSPSEDRGSFIADLESLGPKNGTKADLSAKFDDSGHQDSEGVRGEDAWRSEESEGNSEADSVNEDWSVPIAFPIHRLAWELHQQSIGLFAELSGFLASSPQLRDYENDLQDDLGRLFLWGESFGDGRLDDILADSAELRVAILELCTTISKVLVEDVVPSLEHINQSAAERIHHFLGLIQQSEQAEESYSGYRKDTDTRAYIRERHRSVADAVQIMRSSVDCLMRLLPTMERALAFA